MWLGRKKTKGPKPQVTMLYFVEEVLTDNTALIAGDDSPKTIAEGLTLEEGDMVHLSPDDQTIIRKLSNPI